MAGIQYINENAPECDSQSQQYWILCNIKKDCDSPISGWPEAKVRIMAQNKSKGMAGVGKTPGIIIMMLAMGRYHASRMHLSTPPGWRRAKSLGNFRHRVGNIHEGIFLDDPSREKIDLAGLKSFVTTEENQTCHGRYNDVKLAKNCWIAFIEISLQMTTNCSTANARVASWRMATKM